ncbi:MAG: hypothetical protein KDD38_06420 [Bdellovibrionales bacterium]|nr:hypothetical protein [Bdellovibrionales bacterium]
MLLKIAVQKIWALSIGLVFCSTAFAVDTPTVLPEGIRSFMLKRASISGLNQYYSGSGELNYLSELNSIELDVKNLVRIEPQVQEFVSILNNFGTFELGSQLHLGQISVDANPEVTYYAPMFLFGKTKKLTVGIAVPVIQYKNSINVTQRGSNLAELRNEFGGVSAELDAAFDELNRDMATEFHTTVREQGYEPVENVNDEFIGDITLVAAYQFYKKEKWVNATQFYLGLPTGPKPNADSLTDLETFGKWSLQTQLISEYKIRSKVSLLGTASYLVTLPGEIEKRVPLDANDSLPAKNQKMNLASNTGDSLSAFFGASWQLTPNIMAASAYGIEQKFKDQYSGAPSGRNQFLENGTEREARIGKLEVIYSSVQDYLKGQALLPASIGYELSRIISGVNIENQTKHEVTLSVYF